MMTFSDCRFNSYKCLCIQDMFDCQPSDVFAPVLVCDNTAGSVDTDCSYQQQVIYFTDDHYSR